MSVTVHINGIIFPHTAKVDARSGTLYFSVYDDKSGKHLYKVFTIKDTYDKIMGKVDIYLPYHANVVGKLLEMSSFERENGEDCHTVDMISMHLYPDLNTIPKKLLKYMHKPIRDDYIAQRPQLQGEEYHKPVRDNYLAQRPQLQEDEEEEETYYQPVRDNYLAKRQQPNEPGYYRTG